MSTACLANTHMKLLIILFTLCLSLAAAAEDITTTDGKTYTAATITKVEPDGIRILHESGTAKIPFAKLPLALQQKHGYDPTKAAAFKKAADAALAAQEAALDKEAKLQEGKKQTKVSNDQKLKSAALIYAVVDRVLDGGIIVRGSIPPGIYANPNPQNRKMIEGRIWITGHPEAATLSDNDSLSCLIHPTGKTQQLGGSTLREYEYIGPKP